MRIRKQVAYGLFMCFWTSLLTSLVTARRSALRMWYSKPRPWYCTMMFSLFRASCASFAQRFTTSPAVLARCSELTSAPLETGAFRSTMHCFM
uniref:Putative secreted protein n=1 Tax=Anopheles darlingi TaxID=43151 RepID=A0A2M4DE61_ANODA